MLIQGSSRAATSLAMLSSNAAVIRYHALISLHESQTSVDYRDELLALLKGESDPGVLVVVTLLRCTVGLAVCLN